MRRATTFFIITMALLLLVVAPTTYSYSPDYFNGKYDYYVVIDNTLASDPAESFTLTLKVSVVVQNGVITGIAGEIGNIDVSGTAFKIPNIYDYTLHVLKEWFTNIKFIRRVTGGEKIYTSVNGFIVEAYMVHDGRNIEYREKNTGLYLGGDMHLTIIINAGGLRLKYFVVVSSLLVSVKPSRILETFSIVQPPSTQVLIIGGLIAGLVLLGSIYTVVNWSKYNLDIFS